MRSCVICGGSLKGKKRHAQYCSKSCYLVTMRARRSADLPGQVKCWNGQCWRADCPNPASNQYCSAVCRAIVVHGARHEIDALVMLGKIKASRVWFPPCVDCGRPICKRGRQRTKRCVDCRATQRQVWDFQKNHDRRVQTAGTRALTAKQIAARDGTLCHICHKRVDIHLSGMAKWGPTVEHIIPVSYGGTNDPSNLALAHRYCNISRGNRGHSQLLLIA
jgi:hypothetical protein